MSISDLIPIWEADMRAIVPEFQLLRDDLMSVAFDRVREKLGDRNATDLEVCCQVLRTGSENSVSIRDPRNADEIVRIPAAWWWICASLNVIDDLSSTPWFQLCWWVFEQSRGKGETNTLWGSANCGKTQFFTSLALTSSVVWQSHSHVYITSPFKNHGDDKIWKEIRNVARQWEESPPDWFSRMGLVSTVNKEEITIGNKEDGDGTIKFVALENASSITGKKRKRVAGQGGGDGKQGLMLLISDELTENPAACESFLSAESNYCSNMNFMGFVAFNPKPECVQHANALILSEPKEVPREILNKESDFTWRTALGTLVRLCMANSPNAPCEDEPVYDFLINKRQAEVARKRGDHRAVAQVDAWGWGESDNGCELTPTDCLREDRQDPPAWIVPPIRFFWLDPAFGGRDAASYTCMEYGLAVVYGGERRWVLSGVEAGVLPVTREWTPTADEVKEFRALCQMRGGQLPDGVVAGIKSDSSKLVTYLGLKKASQLNIPRGNFTFDASQRADVAFPLKVALGNLSWYYEGSRKLTDEEGTNWFRFPYQNNPAGDRMKWSDEVSRPISMIWRFAERVISRGHVVGLAKLQKGLAEIRGRRWKASGGTGRMDVEPKVDLRVSPTYAEGIAALIYFAVRFHNVLPDLFNTGNENVGQVSLSDPLFQRRVRRFASAVYK